MSEKAKKIATEHWDWLETLLRKVYIDAFIHGFKHGIEEGTESEEEGFHPQPTQLSRKRG